MNIIPEVINETNINMIFRSFLISSCLAVSNGVNELSEKSIVYIGFGSNMGNRKKNISRAVELIREEDGIKVIELSETYETAPIGPKQRKFYNSCASLSTDYRPEELLKIFNKIEIKLGRKKAQKWGPRVIDIDVLFYGDRKVKKNRLVIPHPEMQKRLFVLDPLSDLCPGKVHPILKETVRKLRSKLIQKKGERNGKTCTVVSRKLENV